MATIGIIVAGKSLKGELQNFNHALKVLASRVGKNGSVRIW